MLTWSMDLLPPTAPSLVFARETCTPYWPNYVSKALSRTRNQRPLLMARQYRAAPAWILRNRLHLRRHSRISFSRSNTSSNSSFSSNTNSYRNNRINSSMNGLSSCVVSSKLGLTQELSFSGICESPTDYTFTRCVGSFISPGIDSR